MIQVTQKSNNKQLVAVCVAWADGSTVEPDGKMENHMKSEINLKTSVQNDIDGVIYVCVCRYSSPCSLSLHLTMVDMLGIRGVCSCRYKVSDVKICITIIQLVALHIFISKSECDFFFSASRSLRRSSPLPHIYSGFELFAGPDIDSLCIEKYNKTQYSHWIKLFYSFQIQEFTIRPKLVRMAFDAIIMRDREKRWMEGMRTFCT